MIDGDDTYKTWCGSLATIIISLWCLLFFWDSLKPILYAEKVPRIAEVIVEDAYPIDMPVTFSDDDFFFAVGLSSKKDFDD